MTTIGGGLVPDSRPDRDVAFDLLVEIVGELSSSGRAPTGSGVRLALKARTYDGFDVKSLGFARFRDFLAAAASQGRIEVDEMRPGDVAVRLPGIASATPVVPPEVRGDLWRAFLEWGPDELRLFDVKEDAVVRLPREPAPLEPERFVVVRRRLAESPDDFVTIPPVSRKQHVQWMHEFARTRTPELRNLLSQALAGDKPAKTFVQVLRALPEERARWNEALLAHVRARVEEWRDSSSLDISIDKRSVGDEGADRSSSSSPGSVSVDGPGTHPSRWLLSGKHAQPPSSDTALTALTALLETRRPRDEAQRFSSVSVRTSQGPERELRNRLHMAIDRMPAEDLRRLLIPVGYLFEE